MVDIYVVLADLDRTYTTKTNPTLVQVIKYVLEANTLLTDWLTSASATVLAGSAKDVGIEIVENKIHNRKVKDHIEGYQYYKPNGLTMDMKDTLLAAKPWSASFSFIPGGS